MRASAMAHVWAAWESSGQHLHRAQTGICSELAFRSGGGRPPELVDQAFGRCGFA